MRHLILLLRGPTHPLISVLTNRPDSWPFLVDSLSALLSHPTRVKEEYNRKLLRFSLNGYFQSTLVKGGGVWNLKRVLSVNIGEGSGWGVWNLKRVLSVNIGEGSGWGAESQTASCELPLINMITTSPLTAVVAEICLASSP
ncbi:hypothetical protein Btru_066304 [Bulinus truncatus]|nr:hypothetical protein Btru_066304 [Bulinus truncatus]